MGCSTSAALSQKRDADTKLAQGRLSVLELAKELGNVAEACRRRGLDRDVRHRFAARRSDDGMVEEMRDQSPVELVTKVLP